MEGGRWKKTKLLEEKQITERQRREWKRRCSDNKALMKDSQHEVLLPAGQVAPDSDGRALHILYFECHISVKLLCLGQMDKERVLD